MIIVGVIIFLLLYLGLIEINLFTLILCLGFIGYGVSKWDKERKRRGQETDTDGSKQGTEATKE